MLHFWLHLHRGLLVKCGMSSSDWYLVGRGGKHQERQLVGYPPDPTRPTDAQLQTTANLATAPANVIASIVQCLLSCPSSAATLAQTCRSFAEQVRLHRSSLLSACISELCPAYEIELNNPAAWRAELCIKLRWPGEYAIRRLYALSSEAEALAAVWESTAAQIRLDAHHCGYHPKHDRAAIYCNILLQSRPALCVPGDWLYNCFVTCAVHALGHHFSQEHCKVNYYVTVDRLCGENKHTLFSENTCFDDNVFERLWSDESGKLPDLEAFEPVVECLPLAQQVIAITGPWHAGKGGELGTVEGDAIIDRTKLDQDFCTWQSWDTDVWMYKPFTCEIAKEPLWYYK